MAKWKRSYCTLHQVGSVWHHESHPRTRKSISASYCGHRQPTYLGFPKAMVRIWIRQWSSEGAVEAILNMTKRKEAPLSCFQLKTCLFAVHHRPLFAIYSVRIKVELSWHVLGLLHRKCAPNDGLMVAISWSTAASCSRFPIFFVRVGCVCARLHSGCCGPTGILSD